VTIRHLRRVSFRASHIGELKQRIANYRWWFVLGWKCHQVESELLQQAQVMDKVGQ
jgi:hypothetical protein